MPNPIIATSLLRAALQEAERELQEASEATQKALERQTVCTDEVASLKKLLIHRAPEDTAVNVPETNPLENPPSERSPVGGGSLIDQIEKIVYAGGDRGMNVPLIVDAATKAGIKMHPNFPYTALRSLVKAERVKKVGLRYYRPGGQLSLVG